MYHLKDLKHLIYFERLLENADNELIEKARADGGVCLGYTCFHIPEVLLNVPGCFSVRFVNSAQGRPGAFSM